MTPATPTRSAPVVRLLRAGTGILTRAGLESPRLDAQILLAEALGVPRFQLVTSPPAGVGPGARRRFSRWIRARAGHEPVAYLVGSREFRDRRFRVDRRVLVPRPETEILVDAAVSWISAKPEARRRVLELGCGSGCVAVSIALACAGADVVATDASEDALEVAAANVRDLAPGRVTLRRGDLFGAVAGHAPFDLVVSNPPYVATGELDAVDRSVREHEPRSAWLAGPDPIAFHRRILDEGAGFTAPGGAILMELGSGAEQVVALARARHPGARVRAVPDLGGAARVVEVLLAP
jgi:release factor glutamine methyltransferase